MSVFILYKIMKNYIIILLVASAALSGCKSKKPAASGSNTQERGPVASTTSSNSADEMTIGTNTGKVSHKYRATGCATVILLTQEGNELTLIPKDKLKSEFDVDGLEVRFNYRTLRMAQPEGCSVGQPAEITELSKK
jgi:hypothetical protein